MAVSNFRGKVACRAGPSIGLGVLSLSRENSRWNQIKANQGIQAIKLFDNFFNRLFGQICYF